MQTHLTHTLQLLIGRDGCETFGICSTLPSLVDQNSYTSETSLVNDPTSDYRISLMLPYARNMHA